MTEFSFPCVSVSSSGGEYSQVYFGDDEDSDEAYLLIQRQFEDYDGGYFYFESPQECLCGHFKIRWAELSRDVLRLEILCRPVETVQIRFHADDAHYKQLKRILSIMIQADVFNVVCLLSFVSRSISSANLSIAVRKARTRASAWTAKSKYRLD